MSNRPRPLLNHFDDMRVFMAVAELSSFTLAAERMGLSRSAVGKSIVRLEESLATRLLHRTTRSVSLSEDGKLFYEHALRILAEVEEAEAALAHRKQEPRGRLRIDLPISLGRLHVAPLLNDYLDEWPDLEADVTFTDDYIDLVREGVDLSIRIGGTDDSRLIQKQLAPHRLITVASPSYLDGHGIPQSPQDLGSHSAVLFTHSRSPVPWRFRVDGEDREFRVSGRMRLSHAEAVRDASIKGVGIAQLGAFLVGDDIRKGRLIPLLERFSMPGQPVIAVYPTKRHLSPKVRKFIDFINLRWSAVPPWPGLPGSIDTEGTSGSSSEQWR